MVTFKQLSGYWMQGHLQGVSWQKDFFDRILRSDDDLVRVLRYVAENPVRAGLVEAWYEYPFIGSDA
jgi:REP element-mobilizing transposase RayT